MSNRRLRIGIELIEGILPAKAAAAENIGDCPAVQLFPEEEAVLASAGGKRRREFAAGRACARAALAGLGVPATPILPGPHGSPCWPPGVTGSITHCRGYQASAVALADEMASIGLDAEPNESLPEAVLDLIADAQERASVTRLLTDAPDIRWDRLLFSAKESVYKAWFPMTFRWLGFSDASVTLDSTDGTFTAVLSVSAVTSARLPLTHFAGRWLARDGLLLTAVAVSQLPSSHIATFEDRSGRRRTANITSVG